MHVDDDDEFYPAFMT